MYGHIQASCDVATGHRMEENLGDKIRPTKLPSSETCPPYRPRFMKNLQDSVQHKPSKHNFSIY